MEEQKPAKHINWTAVIIAGIVVFGGVGLFVANGVKEKNAIERQKIEQQAELEREKLAQQKEMEEAKLQAEKDKEWNKQQNYSFCIEEAEKQYNTNWNTDCELEYQANEKEYQKCFNVNKTTYGESKTKEVCRSFYPALKRTDCTLPKFRAEANDSLLKEEKDRCAKLL